MRNNIANTQTVPCAIFVRFSRLLFVEICGILSVDGAGRPGATSNGRRLALFHGGSFLPPYARKGVLLMVSYSDLIQIGLLIVGIIGLYITANKKK